MVHKVVCNQPRRKSCKIGGHKSLLAAHRSNGKKFLRQRTKTGRATKLHVRQAGYVWAGDRRQQPRRPQPWDAANK